VAKAKVVKLRKPSASARTEVLPAGIHVGRIEMCSDGVYRVRMLTGAMVSARLGSEIGEAFAEECMRDRRTMLLAPGESDEALILGALQTASTTSRDALDVVRLRGRRVEIEADEGLVLQVGKSSLRLDNQGTVKLGGRKMTMDVAEVVRILSALVELP
jgi:hypothetical protein